MKRLLTKENKRSIKEAFKGNAVFRVIDAAYKEQETQMETFRFSPEEIWVNCFIGFDKMLKSREEIGEMTNRMWDDTFCELRDDAQEISRSFDKGELETATSCIIYSIIACMTASDDWELIRHTESLTRQIAEHSNLLAITQLFDRNIENDFVEYIQKYITTGKYISERIESPKSHVDPINPIGGRKDRTKAKTGARKRLEFMKGFLPDGETQIMSAKDYNNMIEAVEYLIENNVVKKHESKIQTYLPIGHLRYTFYLIYKNEGKCVSRQLWLDFLGETFSQMQDNRDSLYNHFSEKPNGYEAYITMSGK